MRIRWLRLGAALWLCAVPAWPQEGMARTLTLEDALAIARERGRSVLLAQGRIEEARARQVQAGRRFQEDPVLEAEAGYRRSGRAGDDFLDLDTAVTQGLYTGSHRAARRAGAAAALGRAEAELAEARRLALREVRTAFARVLAARARIELLAGNRQAAEALLAATERRYDAGEGTALELNRARVAAANARAEQGAAEALERSVRADLQALLGLQEPVEIRGSLTDPTPPPDLAPLLAGIDRRSDLEALTAELRGAEAEILAGQALARPEVGLRGGLAREERADIVRAGIVLSLPVHGRGREAVAVGEARAGALRQALAAARAAAEAEVRGLYDALSRRLAAVRELERTALPALEDNESLALKSFDAGEIGLGELLLIRREIVETRLAYLDRLSEAALTRSDLEAAAGDLP